MSAGLHKIDIRPEGVITWSGLRGKVKARVRGTCRAVRKERVPKVGLDFRFRCFLRREGSNTSNTNGSFVTVSCLSVYPYISILLDQWNGGRNG